MMGLRLRRSWCCSVVGLLADRSPCLRMHHHKLVLDERATRNLGERAVMVLLLRSCWRLSLHDFFQRLHSSQQSAPPSFIDTRSTLPAALLCSLLPRVLQSSLLPDAQTARRPGACQKGTTSKQRRRPHSYHNHSNDRGELANLREQRSNVRSLGRIRKITAAAASNSKDHE